MLIRNTKEFLEKTKTRKILGLDMGKKRIGLAISDPSHKIVNPLEVLKKNKNYLDNLLLIINDFNELDESIKNLVENKQNRIELGQNAKNRAENELIWEKQVVKYNKLIDDIQ